MSLFSSSPGAYCLRSTRLRDLTSSCKSLRDLLPAIVGIVPDPKGGPNLQLAVLSLLHSHGLNPPPTSPPLPPPFTRPLAYHSSTIHLLQSFQGIESAIRQFYFSYQQLVISVMGSGEYNITGMGVMQGMPGGGDALAHIYFEPPYFPSLDGAKTFLGSYWHGSREVEEGVILRELMMEKTVQGGVVVANAGHYANEVSSKSSSVASDGESGESAKKGSEDAELAGQKVRFHSVNRDALTRFVNCLCAKHSSFFLL